MLSRQQNNNYYPPHNTLPIPLEQAQQQPQRRESFKRTLATRMLAGALVIAASATVIESPSFIQSGIDTAKSITKQPYLDTTPPGGVIPLDGQVTLNKKDLHDLVTETPDTFMRHHPRAGEILHGIGADALNSTAAYPDQKDLKKRTLVYEDGNEAAAKDHTLPSAQQIAKATSEIGKIDNTFGKDLTPGHIDGIHRQVLGPALADDRSQEPLVTITGGLIQVDKPTKLH